MLRRFLIVLLVVIVAIAVWVWMSTEKVLSSERSVAAKFSEIVTHYVGMGRQYVTPLSQLSSLPESDLKGLEEIAQDLAALGNAGGIQQKYALLLVAQKRTIDFFTSGGLSEVLVMDPRFTEWNTNATSRGKASVLVLEYNQELQRYLNGMETIAGKLLQYWPRWQFHEFLGIDGKMQTLIEVRL
ncbi:MAG: hypothetical protein WC840_03830 [Candidatus Peribacteraceae bacterium]